MANNSKSKINSVVKKTSIGNSSNSKIGLRRKCKPPIKKYRGQGKP